MTLSGKRSFFVLILAVMMGMTLLNSLLRGQAWTAPEYVFLFIVWMFILYAGVVNFTADKLIKTDAHITAKYKYCGFNWSKSWAVESIDFCSYDGRYLNLQTKDGRKYKLAIQVICTEKEKQEFAISRA